MRQQGRITVWNDDKGFGFISRLAGGPTVFVHAKAFAGRRRPVGNEIVSFETGTDAKGRERAMNVVLAGQPPAKPAAPAAGNLALATAIAFVAAIAWATATDRLPWSIAGVIAVLSIVTFFAYGLDKAAARASRWRTRESTLHLLSLAGGWPGAAAAQRLLRHKNRKTSFLAAFWTTVILNIGAVSWLLSPHATVLLHAIRMLQAD